jgi:hypothetical protein
MSQRRLFALLWTIGAFAAMGWFWYSFSGPYQWFAEWEMRQFGSYEVKLTLFIPLLILLIPAGFIGGWGPPAKRPGAPATRVANARRNARVMMAIGAAALLFGGLAGYLGYLKMNAPLSEARLVLNKGDEPAPVADLVTVTGVVRNDMIVTLTETSAGMTEKWTFVPLVGAAWKAGDPIRFILRTNQNAWIPSGGVGPGEMPHMIGPGNPAFRIITEPSVLARNGLPGVVRTEYEKVHVALDPAVVVVRQSAQEVFTTFLTAAFGGGLVGFILLLAGFLGFVNANKAARA